MKSSMLILRSINNPDFFPSSPFSLVSSSQSPLTELLPRRGGKTLTMKRRGIGRGYVDKKQVADKGMATLGEAVSQQRIEAAKARLEAFKTSLQTFAVSHGTKIKNDPAFRFKFNEMCAKAGVDPLGSSKGFWANLGMGDFYYELGIQVSQVCLVTRTVNGGVLPLAELTERVRAKRPAAQRNDVTSDDVVHAVKKLSQLSPSFKVLSLAGQAKFVQSVPVELSTDGLEVMTYLADTTDHTAHPKGATTLPAIMAHFKWTKDRTTRATEDLLSQSLLWEDSKDNTLWAPTVFGLN